MITRLPQWSRLQWDRRLPVGVVQVRLTIMGIDAAEAASPSAGPLDRSPLASTVASSLVIYPQYFRLRLGLPDDDADWVRCSDVLDDPSFVPRWQAEAAAHLREEHATVPAVTPAAYVLSWYAEGPGMVGAVFFHLARRVPRLGPGALAFRRHVEERYAEGFALLDGRFWCLPDDPAADHPDATVLPDVGALAWRLRAEVRAHADAFLAGYVPGARLPRRSLLGSFFDALDGGLWSAGEQTGDEAAGLRDAALVLPGRTAEFGGASAMYRFTDVRGREHVSRHRAACCYFYRLSGADHPCFTCPRTTDEERVTRAAEWPDE